MKVHHVAVVMPAYNEAPRIGRVLEAVTRCRLASEVIVVSDGSRDETVQIAEAFPGVRVVDLPGNVGKGGAMAVGVASTHARTLVFVDADLDGLTPDHVDSIIQPVLDNRCDMCVGVFRGGRFWSDTSHRISPTISGQRAVRRDLIESIPNLSELRMGIEIALSDAAQRRCARVQHVVLRGVSNICKENKMGLLRGAAARARMYYEIGLAFARVRKHRRLLRVGAHRK